MNFDAYKYHINKKTALGVAMKRDPVHALFFILRGNVVNNSWNIVNLLYKFYFKFK